MKGKRRVVIEPPRLLSASGTGYVQDPKYALGMNARHATPTEHLLGGEADEHAQPPEPEGVDRETQQWITQDAKDREAVIYAEERRRREVRSIAAQVREVGALALKNGMDLPELGRIRSELEAARKRLQRAA